MLPKQYPQNPNFPSAPTTKTYTGPQNSPAVHIELNKDQKIGVSTLIGNQEKIYFAGTLAKINKRQVSQDRIIIITNKFLYNIDPQGAPLSTLFLCSSAEGYTVQRKIPVSKIFGATLSVNPTSEKQQFVIHVKGEYDYLFNGGHKREKFLRSLINAHFLNSSQPFILYLRNEANLSKFHTTDDDFDAKRDKRPKEGQILVTPELAENGVEWIIFNQKNLSNKPSPVTYPPTYQPGPSAPVMNYPNPQYNAGYPSLPSTNGPQWGGSAPTGYPMGGVPQYYIPEVQTQKTQQPQQPNFQAPITNNMNVPYQYPQGNQAPVSPKRVSNTPKSPLRKQDAMTMQAKKQSSSTNDWNFIQNNILPYNGNPNGNVQIQTNFDYAYPNGQQPNNYSPYNGYNTQNQNYRGPGMQ